MKKNSSLLAIVVSLFLGLKILTGCTPQTLSPNWLQQYPVAEGLGYIKGITVTRFGYDAPNGSSYTYVYWKFDVYTWGLQGNRYYPVLMRCPYTIGSGYGAPDAESQNKINAINMSKSVWSVKYSIAPVLYGQIVDGYIVRPGGNYFMLTQMDEILGSTTWRMPY